MSPADGDLRSEPGTLEHLLEELERNPRLQLVPLAAQDTNEPSPSLLESASEEERYTATSLLDPLADAFELGLASRSLFHLRAWSLLVWAVRNHDDSQGPLISFATSLARKKIIARWPRRGVRREREDEIHREAALADPDELVRFIARWRERLDKLQKSYPKQWSIPGCDAEEARERLLDALLAAMLDGGDAVANCAVPWTEATFRFLRRERSRRRNRRTRFALVEGYEASYRYELPSVPTPEELFLEREMIEGVRRDLERVEQSLSKTSHRYFRLMQEVVANDDQRSDEVCASHHGRWTTLAAIARRDRTSVRDGVSTLAARLRRAGLHHHLEEPPAE